MTEYQKIKQTELQNQGWTPQGWHIANYIWTMESASGMRAYIYPNWVQFIA
jgi:hypothetical protein